MKHLFSALVFSAALLSTVESSPLPKARISADAKWLVHLDLDNFRATQVGKYVGKEILADALAELKTGLKIDFLALYQNVHAITAYGTDYQMNEKVNGVLMIHTDAETQKIVEGLLVAQILSNPNGPIRKIQEEPAALYAIDKQLFISPSQGDLLLVGKSQPQIEKAQTVLAGKSKSLNSSKTFSGFAELPNSFFFLGVAEGFNQAAPVPPQAKILQMADGGRLLLGEKAGQLFLNLALRTKTAELSKQIQQIINGMIALLSLSQNENKDLQQLIQSTRISGKDNLVSIALEYPVADAVKRLGEEAKSQKRARLQRENNSNTKSNSEPPAKKKDE